MPFFAYFLKCSDGTYYCGSTPDLEKRLHEHNHLKTGAKYTRSRRPVELAYSEAFETRSESLKRECEMKKMTRLQKEALVSQRRNPNAL